MKVSMKFFLVGVVASFVLLMVVGIRGDNLFSICQVEDSESNFEYQLMAFWNVTTGVCDWPRFAGGLDAATITSLCWDLGLAGIHVNYHDGLLYAATIPYFGDAAYESVTRDAPEKKGTLAFELGEIGNTWGGQTALRKFTRYSPNGRVDFTGGWSDTLFSNVPGPGLTGDCTGNFYSFDQTNGFLSSLTPNYNAKSAGYQSSLAAGLYNPNYGFNVDHEECFEVIGVTFNTVNRLFYTVYTGILYNSTVLFVTSLDPKLGVWSTFYIADFTLFDEGAYAPFDALEASADGTSLWLMVVDEVCAPTQRSEDNENPEQSRVKLGRGPRRNSNNKRCTNRRATNELQESYNAEVRTRNQQGQRSPPTLITQFYSINLAGQTITQASEPYYGVLCGGLTQINSPCRRGKRSDPNSFEAVLGNLDLDITAAPARSFGVRS